MDVPAPTAQILQIDQRNPMSRPQSQRELCKEDLTYGQKMDSSVVLIDNKAARSSAANIDTSNGKLPKSMHQKNWYARLTPEEKSKHLKEKMARRKRKKISDAASTSHHVPHNDKVVTGQPTTKEDQRSSKRAKQSEQHSSSATTHTLHNVTEKDTQSSRCIKQRNWYANLTTEQKSKLIQKKVSNRKNKQPSCTAMFATLPDPTETIPTVNVESNEKGPQFSDSQLSELHVLKNVSPCSICGAKRFQYEPANFCCAQGDVLLSSPEVPEFLWTLFTSQSEECRQFRHNIRAYNSIFGFTSFGVNLDKDLATSRSGVYTFRAQGQIYHNLPSMIPSERGPCYFQMYFYDTDNELQNRMNVLPNAPLNESIVGGLMDMLASNPYVQVLRSINQEQLENCKIHIRSDAQLDQRVYNAPSADQVAGIWIEGNNPCARHERDIIVHSNSGTMHKVRHYYGCYDPLQYPLLFPHGEVGWHQNILKKEGNQATKKARRRLLSPNNDSVTNAVDIFTQEQQGVDGGGHDKVSCRQYYCYKLQKRENDRSILLLSGRLLQQYIVDMYIKLENTRLDFYRQRQSSIRAELYHGILESIRAGETNGRNVGKNVVLPPSFVGGPRDMRRRYMDAMSLVQRLGKPDLFITMTCNPEWKEITESLEEGQVAQERPDIIARVFRAKLQDLKEQLFKKRIFGDVAAHVHVIEFQKRGLPHAHFLIILKQDFKIMSSEQFDKYVCAEIPDPIKYPDLHAKVVKHMMHGPCGHINMKNPCMREGKCKNHYPRSFSEKTMESEGSYPIYRRRKDSFEVHVRTATLNNRWVVPYNPYLLSRYNCHINVEICSSVKAVKYLYKYIYKGHDKVAFTVSLDEGDRTVDEIRSFQQARWVSAPEAVWRLFGVSLNEIYPAVIRLQLHLPDKQCVSYWANQDLQNVVASDSASKTMLTEFFTYCWNNKNQKQHLYREFPEHFVWDAKGKFWKERQTRDVIGRINGCHPAEGERYFLRLLLNHVRSPKSFIDLLTVDGVICSSFKNAAERRGLFQSDNWISESLSEAVAFQMPKSLRQLFATILVYCEPGDVMKLWNEHFQSLSEDFEHIEGICSEIILFKTLQGVDSFLQSMGKSIKHYDLPALPSSVHEIDLKKKEILEELAVEVPHEDKVANERLNLEQLTAYNTIMNLVSTNKEGVFFVDGPGGTGKTFLYRALLATTRMKGQIAIATATSGVAASIMPGGRTAHSRFKIPIDADESSICNIPKQSGTAALLKIAKLIIWDEAPMAKRTAIEALDRSMRDIMSNDKLFGGKVIVFGGDFRQVLPVVPRGSREETVNTSLVKSYLWPHMCHLKLTTNMRAQNDTPFSEFLLRVGNGEEPMTDDDMIQIPGQMIIQSHDTETPESCLINAIYPSLMENAHRAEYITNRAILATKNEYVDMLNEKMIQLFPGREYRYHSFDEAIDDTHNYYPDEFLNSLIPNGLPPHELILKINSPIMLLRNINPSEGLCNGTRLVCKGFQKNVIHAEITLGQHAGKPVFLPRIPLLPPEDESFPFKFKRTQFPVRLCFAMTINKSQGQTIQNVGVYLPQSVFSHGQLYVALSRGISMSNTKVVLKTNSKSGKKNESTCTGNVVYKEVLTS